jgi:ElaB/YqjD/DUF883 family membrane-anchored ribosome-binding protein
MFSIKQFLINASSEVRQEIKNLIDEIEASISAEAPVVEETATSVKTKAKAVEADAPAAE